MSSTAYMLHPMVSKLFVDVVQQLMPELAPPELLPSGQALRLTHEQGYELLELAIQLTGRADLGVLAAEAAEPGHFELIEVASRTQDTVREALIHTAAWDHSYQLAGKRVAVIGTGATSVQLVPELAKTVAQLDVYQRTPIWVAYKPDAEVPRWRQRLYAKFPWVQRVLRFFNVLLSDLSYGAAVLQHRRLPLLTKLAEHHCRRHMRAAIPDPELRARLTPRYEFGCKRPTFSNTYYPTFTLPHVKLVTDPIARIEADGIVTQAGDKREIDVLVLATGFNVWERDSADAIRGKGGVELHELWEATRFGAYEGMTIPGFPNLFHLPSPYSYTGLSFFFTIEGQMQHIVRCMREMRARAATSFEVTPEAYDAYVDAMTARGRHTVWTRKSCAGTYSYYFDSHGQPSLVRPMSAAEGELRQRFFPLQSYRFE